MQRQLGHRHLDTATEKRSATTESSTLADTHPDAPRIDVFNHVQL